MNNWLFCLCRPSGQLGGHTLPSLIWWKTSGWECTPCWRDSAPTAPGWRAQTTLSWCRNLPEQASPDAFIDLSLTNQNEILAVSRLVWGCAYWLVLFPFLPVGLVGSAVKDFNCVFYNMEYLTCSWRGSRKTAGKSQQNLYYWYDSLSATLVQNNISAVLLAGFLLYCVYSGSPEGEPQWLWPWQLFNG